MSLRLKCPRNLICIAINFYIASHYFLYATKYNDIALERLHSISFMQYLMEKTAVLSAYISRKKFHAKQRTKNIALKQYF